MRTAPAPAISRFWPRAVQTAGLNGEKERARASGERRRFPGEFTSHSSRFAVLRAPLEYTGAPPHPPRRAGVRGRARCASAYTDSAGALYKLRRLAAQWRARDAL